MTIMLLGSIFERFIVHSPISVMARGLLELALLPAELDTLVRTHGPTSIHPHKAFGVK
jgi:hypothetical protein